MELNSTPKSWVDIAGMSKVYDIFDQSLKNSVESNLYIKIPIKAMLMKIPNKNFFMLILEASHAVCQQGNESECEKQSDLPLFPHC